MLHLLLYWILGTILIWGALLIYSEELPEGQQW